MKKNNPEVEAFIFLVASSILFCHIANNTKKIYRVPSCLGSLLDYTVPYSNSVEGALGETFAFFVCQ